MTTLSDDALESFRFMGNPQCDATVKLKALVPELNLSGTQLGLFEAILLNRTNDTDHPRDMDAAFEIFCKLFRYLNRPEAAALFCQLQRWFCISGQGFQQVPDMKKLDLWTERIDFVIMMRCEVAARDIGHSGMLGFSHEAIHKWAMGHLEEDIISKFRTNDTAMMISAICQFVLCEDRRKILSWLACVNGAEYRLIEVVKELERWCVSKDRRCATGRMIAAIEKVLDV